MINKEVRGNMFSKNMIRINIVLMSNKTYLLDDDSNYKILILYTLRTLNNDIKTKIYDILVTYEIIEIMEQGWTELIIPDDINDLDLYELDLYPDL